MIIEIIFWTSLILLTYTFIGYPLVIKVLATVVGKGTQLNAEYLPTVSILLSVYNEEDVIESKIANVTALG